MFVVALHVWLGLLGSEAYAQWAENAARAMFVPATSVSFSVSTDKNRYSLREGIPLKYRIVNISNGPVYVPRATLEGCPTVTLHVAA